MKLMNQYAFLSSVVKNSDEMKRKNTADMYTSRATTIQKVLEE
jgi:hypothetical protein